MTTTILRIPGVGKVVRTYSNEVATVLLDDGWKLMCKCKDGGDKTEYVLGKQLGKSEMAYVIPIPSLLERMPVR